MSEVNSALPDKAEFGKNSYMSPCRRIIRTNVPNIFIRGGTPGHRIDNLWRVTHGDESKEPYLLTDHSWEILYCGTLRECKKFVAKYLEGLKKEAVDVSLHIGAHNGH